MRFRIHLSLTKPEKRTLPVNYQYPLSAWIYKTISQGNHEFARFLHECGFGFGKRSYKLFTFSWFYFPPRGYKVENDRLHILHREFCFDISFLAPAAMQHFVSGLFAEQTFTLGDQQNQVPLIVKSIEALPMPAFEKVMYYRTGSPILVSTLAPGAKHATYLNPEDPQFGKLMADNLLQKYFAAADAGLMRADLSLQDATKPAFRLLTEPRSKVILVKAGSPQQTHIRAYLFDFELTTHPALHQVGYLSGFGEKNSLGLGGVSLLV